MSNTARRHEQSRKLDSSNFERWREDWLDQVNADPALPPAAFKIAYAIGKHLNRTHRTAYPGVSRLAAQTTMTPRNARRMVRALVRGRHLKRDPRKTEHGDDDSYLCRPIVHASGTDSSVSTPGQNCQDGTDNPVRRGTDRTVTQTSYLEPHIEPCAGARADSAPRKIEPEHEPQTADDEPRISAEQWAELKRALATNTDKLTETKRRRS